MKRRFPSASVATAITAAIGLTGCQAKPKPASPPPPPAALTVPQQRAADAAAFRSALAKYDADLAGLPGRTGPDHRAAAAATLADLTDVLRLAHGVNPSPGFANDVAIVDAAAKAVAVPDVPRGRIEAAENQALHAATAGLTEIATRVLFDDPALPPLIDAATAKAVAARDSQGPLHDGDATDGLSAIGVALHQVDAGLQERFARPVAVADPVPPAPPVPVPTPTTATAPDVTPTTAPTTTAPTTMP